MEKTKRITVEVPEHILRQATEATGKNISETIRYSLEIVAASVAFNELPSFRGKLKLTPWKKLKEDRS